MDERKFWIHLEYRVCFELAGFRHAATRIYWCDGFVPQQYILDDPNPRILGYAWIWIGSNYEDRYAFTLLLDQPVPSAEEIDWSALLPPDDVTRWLTVDPGRKQLVIEPSAAVPDDPLPPRSTAEVPLPDVPILRWPVRRRRGRWSGRGRR